MRVILKLRRLLFNSVIRKILDLITIEEGIRVLDLGCGQDRFFNANNFYGLDIDCRIRCYLKRLAIGDCRQMPFPDAIFDCVVVLLLLHSLSRNDINETLKEIRRILNRNGRLIVFDVCSPNGFWSRIAGKFLSLEERLCPEEHCENYLDFIARGGIEKVLEENQMPYRVIKKYRLGNLLLTLTCF